MPCPQPTLDELRRKYADVMADQAVTNVSGWTEPNHDEPCDEYAYRERLHKNAPILFDKINEALKFD